MAITTQKSVKFLLALAVFLNCGLWLSLRDVQARWLNVPPAPQKVWAASSGLGDAQFSYRIIGLMIQNLGDSGGRVTSLKEYNYETLAQWFFVEEFLDARSDYAPYLAAYYFGGVQEPLKFLPVLDYLVQAGSGAGDEKWRWLAQAVFLARFKMNDMDRALSLAQKLASLPNPNLPAWARQMPAFVMAAKGEKQAAYALMLEILKTQGKKMHPNEVTSMKYYICQRILMRDEALEDPLCQGIPLKN